MDSDDIILIQEYLRGSERAFEELYMRYRQPLYHYLCGMLSHADAEDVFQQTWIKVSISLSAYEEQGRFQSWLFCVARSRALDCIRRKRREPEMAELMEMPDMAINDETQLDEELCRVIDEALETLPENQKIVFQMRKEGISFRKIAAAQNCELNTAVKRMGHAVEKIRKIVRNLYGG